MLGFFFRHYDPFVTRYTIFDDGSDDGSLSAPSAPTLGRSSACTGSLASDRSCDRTQALEQLLEGELRRCGLGHCGEIDEHLDHPDMVGYLAACSAQGVTIIPPSAFHDLEVLSETPTSGFAQRSLSASIARV